MDVNIRTSTVAKLLDIRARIEELEAVELTLISAIVDEAEHKVEGQRTYEIDGRKVIIKTATNYTLDKAMLNSIWFPEMPINRTYSYTLREKDYKAAMQHGTSDVKRLLADIVTAKPAKPAVTIGD